MLQESIKVSLIAVNNIIVVTYFSKCHRLSLSLIAVNGITLMDKPYQEHSHHEILPVRISSSFVATVEVLSVSKTSFASRRYVMYKGSAPQ